MGKIDRDLLERYMDGELGERASARVASMLEHSPESQKHLDHDRKLGELLRFSNDVRSQEVTFEGLADRVMNGIQKEDKPLPVSTRIRVWAEEFFRYKRAVWIPAMAMSAAGLLAVLVIPLSTPGTAPNQSVDNGFAPYSVEVPKETTGSEIASVDFGTAAGKTFQLESDSKGTIAVVWIEETP